MNWIKMKSLKVQSQSTSLHILLTLMTRLIVLFGSFIVSVIIARVIGPEGRGIVTSIMVVPLLLISLAELGLRQSAAFYVGKKIKTVEEVISTLSFLWVLTSLVSLILVIWIFSISFSSYDYYLLLIAAATIPFNLIINYSKGILQGVQKYATVNSFEIYKILSNLFLVVLLVWLFDLGVTGAILVQLFIGAIVAIYSLKVIKNDYSIGYKINIDLAKDLFLKGISFGLALFILQLNYRVDILFLNKYETISNVGIYSVGTNLAELVWQLPAAISLVLFGKSANSKNEIEAINRTKVLIRCITPFLLVFCLFLVLFAEPLVQLLYGNSYIESARIIKYLIPGVFFMVIVKVLHADLSGRGFPLYAIWVTIGPLLVNILLNYIFIPKYGIDGAAVTSTISYFLSGLLFIFVYSKRENIIIKELILINRDDIGKIKNTLKNIYKKIKK